MSPVALESGNNMNAVAANDLVDRATRTLDTISNAALATMGQDGRPWNSPLYVAFDERLTFYWASQRDAVHSENIRANPDVMLVIFDSAEPDDSGHAVYLRGKAAEITDATTLHAALKCIARRKREPPKAAGDFGPPHERRMYKMVPEMIWTNAVQIRDGHYVDERCEIKLHSGASRG